MWNIKRNGNVVWTGEERPDYWDARTIINRLDFVADGELFSVVDPGGNRVDRWTFCGVCDRLAGDAHVCGSPDRDGFSPPPNAGSAVLFM